MSKRKQPHGNESVTTRSKSSAASKRTRRGGEGSEEAAFESEIGKLKDDHGHLGGAHQSGNRKVTPSVAGNERSEGSNETVQHEVPQHDVRVHDEQLLESVDVPERGPGVSGRKLAPVAEDSEHNGRRTKYSNYEPDVDSTSGRAGGARNTGVRTEGTGEFKYQLVDHNAHNFTLKKIKPIQNLAFKSFSPEGLRVGKDKADGKKGALYMRFQNGSNLKNVKQFLLDVDKFTTDLYWDARDAIFERFSIDLPSCMAEPTSILKKGWAERIKNDETKEDLCIFPHAQYTKLHKIVTDKEGKTSVKPIKTKSLFAHIDRLANSDWIVSVAINAIRVSYQPNRNWITLEPMFTVRKLAYIDKGQDITLDQAAVEQSEKEREEASNAELLKLVDL